jgi:chitodextrinase
VNAIWKIEAVDIEAPTAATSLTVTSTTSNSASLSWTAATDNVAVTGYDIYVNGTLQKLD